MSHFYLKELCHELRGYSVITHLALKIRSSVKKPLLIKHVNIGYSWPSSSFSFPTLIRDKILIKLTSSISKLSSQQGANNTKTTNYHDISSTSFLFDFGFRIQNQKVRLAWQPRRS